MENKSILIKTKDLIKTTKSKKYLQIKNEIKKINNSIIIEQSYAIDKHKSRIIHIFADIDSTLTHTGTSAINKDVKSMIENIKEQNSEFYFCSGRSFQDINRLRKIYNTGEYGIAENGGIILGMLEPKEKFGDRSEPDKLMTYLLSNFKVKIDPKQSNRMTEYVILLNSIKRSELKNAIKKCKAKVEIHTSKNTYHISKRGVNKGTAIEYLTSELNLDSKIHYHVAVGDSDLDMPMFRYVDKGFLINPDKKMKEECKKIKKIKFIGNTPKALKNMYQDLFPYD